MQRDSRQDQRAPACRYSRRQDRPRQSVRSFAHCHILSLRESHLVGVGASILDQKLPGGNTITIFQSACSREPFTRRINTRHCTILMRYPSDSSISSLGNHRNLLRMFEGRHNWHNFVGEIRSVGPRRRDLENIEGIFWCFAFIRVASVMTTSE